jgi:hypothetical protein
MTYLTNIVDQFEEADRHPGSWYKDDPNYPDCRHDEPEFIDYTDPKRPYCCQCGLTFDEFGSPLLYNEHF